MRVTFENRPVDISITGATFDHDYWCDAFIEEATWEDTGIELDRDEMDRIDDEFRRDDTWLMKWLY